MTDEPATTYVVSVFEKSHWRTVLTTKDKAKALAGRERSATTCGSRRSRRRRRVKVAGTYPVGEYPE